MIFIDLYQNLFVPMCGRWPFVSCQSLRVDKPVAVPPVRVKVCFGRCVAREVEKDEHGDSIAGSKARLPADTYPELPSTARPRAMQGNLKSHSILESNALR